MDLPKTLNTYSSYYVDVKLAKFETITQSCKENHATLLFYYLNNHPKTAQWIELKSSGIMLLIPTNICKKKYFRHTPLDDEITKPLFFFYPISP